MGGGDFHQDAGQSAFREGWDGRCGTGEGSRGRRRRTRLDRDGGGAEWNCFEGGRGDGERFGGRRGAQHVHVGRGRCERRVERAAGRRHRFLEGGGFGTFDPNRSRAVICERKTKYWMNVCALTGTIQRDPRRRTSSWRVCGEPLAAHFAGIVGESHRLKIMPSE